MAVVAVTQLHAPSTLWTTHTHTPSVLLTWLMDKLQRSDTLVGDLQSPRDHSLRSSETISFSAQKPTTKSLLHSAALCCLLRKLQLNRRTLKNTCFLLVVAICQTPHRDCVTFQKHQTFSLTTFCSKYPYTDLRKKKPLLLNFQDLWNHHNITLWRGINRYWHYWQTAKRRHSEVVRIRPENEVKHEN